MRILESAILGPSGQAVGPTIWGQQFLGARFHLSRPVQVTSVGGHVASDSGETLFAAIVRLAGPLGLPAFAPRTIESAALASAVFRPPLPSADTFIPLSVSLGPGDYALVFGGADSAANFLPFGATGTGTMAVTNVANPTASYILGDSVRWLDGLDLAATRFVIEADTSPTAPSAPSNVTVL
jgi:hypothetical protein